MISRNIVLAEVSFYTGGLVSPQEALTALLVSAGLLGCDWDRGNFIAVFMETDMFAKKERKEEQH